MTELEQKYGKAYWFDDLFNADKEYGIPSRENRTIEDVERMIRKQEALDAEPHTLVDVFRKQSEVNNAF